MFDYCSINSIDFYSHLIINRSMSKKCSRPFHNHERNKTCFEHRIDNTRNKYKKNMTFKYKINYIGNMHKEKQDI